MRRLLLLVAVSAASLPCAPAQAHWPVADGSPSPPATSDWLSYGHDDQLTNLAGGSLTDDDARALATRWTAELDAGVFASPLLFENRLYIATTGGSVYALDATTGSLIWQRELGIREAGGGCGIYGIASTPAIDAGRGLLYVVQPDGLLQALDLADGTTAPGWPVELTQRPDWEYVWGGLRIFKNRVFVPIASYCDVPDADGRPAEGSLVAIDLDTRRVAASFDPVPGPFNLGGPWGYGGVSVEPDGTYLYSAFGNSQVLDKSCDCFFDAAGYGDSIVRLTPDLTPVDSDRPKDIPTSGDYDFGSAPLLFQPDGCPPLAAANNKDGLLYVWRRSRLSDGPVLADAIGDVRTVFNAAPSWSPSLAMFYVANTRNATSPLDGITAYVVDRKCRFGRVWHVGTGQGPQPPPLVDGGVVFANGGSTGGFVAIDAFTGALLWRFRTDGRTLAPTIGSGDTVYTADTDGVVRAFAPAPEG